MSCHRNTINKYLVNRRNQCPQLSVLQKGSQSGSKIQNLRPQPSPQRLHLQEATVEESLPTATEEETDDATATTIVDGASEISALSDSAESAALADVSVSPISADDSPLASAVATEQLNGHSITAPKVWQLAL